jgi:methyl acetate hydrolase
MNFDGPTRRIHGVQATKNQAVERLNGILSEATKTGRVPGIVAVAGSDLGVTYEAAYGTREANTNVVMTPDTVGYIASMTKPITAAAAMQLVERGRLALDTPAAEVIGDLADVQVLEGFDTEGKPLLRRPKRAITLQHLLAHTSGFCYEIWSPALRRFQQATGTPSIFSSRNAALNLPLLCDPGEQWVYGIGIDWAGKMIEAESGQKLGSYLQANFFEPLGMASTSFALGPSQRDRLAAMHERRPDGSVGLRAFEFIQEPEFEQGGGGLYSTMQDYIRFTRMILNGGKLDSAVVLKPETVDLMAANHIGTLECGSLMTAMPEYSNDANFFPAMSQKWGLSFLINTEETEQGRSAGSLSWAGLSNCYFWVDLTKRVTGAFMTQIFPFFDREAVTLFRAFEKGVYEMLCEQK